VGLTLTLIAGLVASEPVAADGYFKAKNLSDCIEYTESDLQQAPPGTELAFGGIRLYRGDRMHGRSVTYCLTVDWDGGPHCCAASEQITLPRWIRRDVESLRLAVAPACSLDVDLYTWQRVLIKRELHSLGATEPKKRHRRIAETLDDKATRIDAGLFCWEGS
jgi:hypothetical protein